MQFITQTRHCLWVATVNRAKILPHGAASEMPQFQNLRFLHELFHLSASSTATQCYIQSSMDSAMCVV
jgi:hypothetical protein